MTSDFAMLSILFSVSVINPLREPSPLWEPLPYRGGEVCVSIWTWELCYLELAAPGRDSHGEEATWLPPSPLLRPVASPFTGRTAGVGCAARQVAVKAEGLDGPYRGSRSWLWGYGTSPLWGLEKPWRRTFGQHQSISGKPFDTSGGGNGNHPSCIK